MLLKRLNTAALPIASKSKYFSVLCSGRIRAADFVTHRNAFRDRGRRPLAVGALQNTFAGAE